MITTEIPILVEMPQIMTRAIATTMVIVIIMGKAIVQQVTGIAIIMDFTTVLTVG